VYKQTHLFVCSFDRCEHFVYSLEPAPTADFAHFQPAPTADFDFTTEFSPEIADAAVVDPTSTHFETEVIDTIEIETEEEVQYTLAFETDLTEIAMVLMISLALVVFFKFLKSKKKQSTVQFFETGRSEEAEQVKKFEKNCVENQNEKVYRLVIDDAAC